MGIPRRLYLVRFLRLRKKRGHHPRRASQKTSLPLVLLICLLLFLLTPLYQGQSHFPMYEGPLHDSGISQEYLPVWQQLPHSKAIYLCTFWCGYHAQSRATVCTRTCKEHLNTMLGCPHCEHCVWSTGAWAKHIQTHHTGFPLFMEMKLECVTPKESEEIFWWFSPLCKFHEMFHLPLPN